MQPHNEEERNSRSTQVIINKRYNMSVNYFWQMVMIFMWFIMCYHVLSCLIMFYHVLSCIVNCHSCPTVWFKCCSIFQQFPHEFVTEVTVACWGPYLGTGFIADHHKNKSKVLSDARAKFCFWASEVPPVIGWKGVWARLLMFPAPSKTRAAKAQDFQLVEASFRDYSAPVWGGRYPLLMKWCRF